MRAARGEWRPSALLLRRERSGAVELSTSLVLRDSTAAHPP